MQHRTIVIGQACRSAVLRTMELLNAAGGATALDVHFLVLEGDNAADLKASGIDRDRRVSWIPEPRSVRMDWARRFRIAKAHVRRTLGDHAFDGHDIAAMLELLEDAEARGLLARYVRGAAAPDDDACFREGAEGTALRSALLARCAAIGQTPALEAALGFLRGHPRLGDLRAATDPSAAAFDVRPSEYLLHVQRDCALAPAEWDAVDLIVLDVEDRNAFDILDRCFLRDPARYGLKASTSGVVVALRWPNPRATSPVSGSAWSQLAYANAKRKLLARTAEIARFGGLFLHVMETENGSERPLDLADILEAFAYSRAEEPERWRPLGGATSAVMGLARAVAEPARRGARKRGELLTIVAPLEAATEWAVGPQSRLEVSVGAWSLPPGLWECHEDCLCMAATLFASEPLRASLEPMSVAARWRAATPAPSGGELDGPPRRLPYQNLLLALVTLQLPCPVPLREL